MYEEYFEKSPSETSINSAAQQVLNHEDSPSTSSIVVEEHKAPPIVTASEEQTSPISFNEADEFNQEDSADFDGNTVFVPYDVLNFEEAESSTTALDPSNMHEFHQVQPSTHIWTKAHPLEQVIGDTSKPVMTRQRLQTDSEVCMYALTVSTLEPKNIKEAMLDHNWIKSIQDKLHQFERLDVWELVPIPDGKNIIVVQWLWKNKSDAKNIVIQNKSRLVAKGYKHEECIDFEDSFTSVALLESIRIQPEGFFDPDFPDHVYKMKKTLYGLKQAPRAWYDKLSSFLIEHHFTKASRPDIAFATFVCARYQARPTIKDLKEVKRIFQYLRQSYNMDLWYLKDSGFELISYSDANHAGCKDDCKSTSEGLQFLGEKLVSWSSKKQDCTMMSTAEAEYVSLSACCAQVIWMRTQLLDYGYKSNRILMYYDSKSAIAISCNPVQHSRTKHIDIWYHFIKEHVEKETVELYFVGIEYQLTDLFTKALPKERFKYLVHCIVITEYLVNTSKKARILELKRRYFEDYYSEDQYVCIHQGRYGVFVPALTKDHEGNKINTPYLEEGYTRYPKYRRLKFLKISNVVPTPRNPNTPYPRLWIRRIELTPDLINIKLKNEF
ncbi:retrovirus-related pol polyprotein from transposon TNT 1-94 [Tanacetum coccineum]|uniref:Retrovirus-related pol polyprotein from transposon TNT 1-94 n=1 Tax=Tanacetum coccineum TaxID=301880 RepID=A0ABQ4X2W0_9ASTR